MKRFAYFLHYVFFVITLISCTISNQANQLVKPGDRIGEMTVDQGIFYLPYPHIYEFCEDMPDDAEKRVMDFIKDLIERGYAGYEVQKA